MYFLSFKSYVVLPVIIFVLAMVFRIKIGIAIKSALTMGVGFVGIFMTFDYFIAIINPVVLSLVERTGFDFTVLDAGWPSLAAITWSFELAPLLLIILIGLNVAMLLLKITKTVNIDIWNYWHVILAATMVYQVTQSAFITIVLTMIVFAMLLKLAEWTAPMVNKFSGMEGICIPHLSGIVHFPLALLANKLMDKIPRFKEIDAKPEAIQSRFGILGDPMVLGVLMGLGLGFGGGYAVKETSELAVGFAAVIYILPKMAEILGTALIPISEGMKTFITTKFSDMGTTYIGLDVAILFGIPSVLVTSLLLIPVSLIAAFILPGISFIPLGELTILVVPLSFICLATNGNVIRSFVIGVPMVVSSLYIASSMAVFLTEMAASNNYKIANYDGIFTSFIEGGNFFRAWLTQIVSLNKMGFILLPIVIIMIVFTWKETKRINKMNCK